MAETAADRVATFVEAFMANPYRHGHPAILTIAGEATDHKDLSLDANDVAEVVSPELRLIFDMRAALAVEVPEREADVYRCVTGDRLIDQLELDEDGLEELTEKLDRLREALLTVRDRAGIHLHGMRRLRRAAEQRSKRND